MVVFSASASLFLFPRAAVRRPLEPRLTVRPPLALFVAPRVPFNLFHLTLDADHMEFRGISNYATRSPFPHPFARRRVDIASSYRSVR